MPRKEAESIDVNECQYFASLHHYDGYQPGLLSPLSSDLCAIRAPNETFLSTGVVHRMERAPVFFQTAIPPLIINESGAMELLVDEFSQMPIPVASGSYTAKVL